MSLVRPTQLALCSLLLAESALAGEPLPMARASFPLVPGASASGALPPLPAPPPRQPPPQARPAAPAEWEVVVARPSAPPPQALRPEVPDSVERPSRERDRWMLSLEGATRAPVDAGVQATLETPAGLRCFGAYGAVPSMYLGRITGTAAEVSSDPVLGAMLEDGFQGGRVWRAGLGWRPFRRVGVYLDAGYARVSLRGALDTAAISGIPGLTGRYDVESALGLGFVELGYQAKIAERIVLAAALGVTKVTSAETRATPSGGAATDPRIDQAAASVDDGLERYGYLPTLTLRLGLDLI